MTVAARRLALITGASRGIGCAFAHRLAKDGYDLILSARNGEALAQLAEQLQARHGANIRCMQVDLSQPDGAQNLLAQCASLPIDLLINNAGSGLGQTFLEQTPQALSSMLQLNVVSLTTLTRGLLPTLLARKGAIINVASQAAFFPMPRLAAYAASKAYVLHLSEAIAEELRDQEVHVMVLCPGPTQTAFFSHADIKLEQTRMRPVPVERVIEEGMRALARKKRIHVVGAINRLSTWAPRLLPRSWIARANLHFMQR